MENHRTYTAFLGDRLIASGDLKTTVLRVKKRLDSGEDAPILVFDDHNGQQLDFDLRGTPQDALARLTTHPYFTHQDPAPIPRVGPGRPKLGVISREITLLPRHWVWLEQQPRGISATIRKLVEEAKRREPDKERARLAREATGKFMGAIAGDLPGFEEASRALYAMDSKSFDKLIRRWPKDIRTHIGRLVKEAMQVTDGDLPST